jgi:hypothetical protein
MMILALANQQGRWSRDDILEALDLSGRRITIITGAATREWTVHAVRR